MGGGSSNDQKVNQIHSQAYQQLRKQILVPNHQNSAKKDNSKLNSPLNSPKNSPKNSARNKNNSIHEPPQQSSFKNSKLNSPRQSKNPSGLKFNSPRQSKNPSSLKGKQQPDNQDLINQNDIRKPSQEGKQILGNIEFSKKGKYKVGILLLKMTPNNIGHQIKPQKSQFNYEAFLTWDFDQRTKKWNFSLEKPQSTELSFTVNQRGYAVKGQQDKWDLFNPSYADLPMKQTQFHKEQFTTESLETNSYWLPSFDQLKANRRSLYNEWNQDYNQRAVEFPPVKNLSKTSKSEGKLTEFKAYHELRKFFEKESDDWQLTLDIVENDYKFHVFMTWKIQPEDERLNELIERQKRIMGLKRQIYEQRLKFLSFNK